MECLASDKGISRMASFMAPDYKAWKATREKHHIQLRAETRLKIAEKRRQNVKTVSVPLSQPVSVICDSLLNPDPRVCLQALSELKSVLTTMVTDGKATDSGVVERLNQVLKTNLKDVEIVTEAIWCLSLVTSGPMDNTKAGLYYDIVPTLIDFVTPDCFQVTVLAVWLVANLAAISQQIRELAYQQGLLSRLFAVLSNSCEHEMKSITWTLVLLLRDFAFDRYTFEGDWLRILIEVVMKSRDSDLWMDVLDAISLVIEACPQFVDMILDHSFGETALNLMESDIDPLRVAALKAVRSILRYPEKSLYRLIAHGLFDTLAKTIIYSTPAVVREALSVLSDLSASRPLAEVQKLIQLLVFPRILELVRTASHSTRVSALWAISSIIMHGMWPVFTHLMDSDLIDTLANVLNEGETELTNVGLDILLETLRICKETDQGENRAAKEMREKGFVDVIENLLGHPNPAVYQKANHILEDFFEFRSEGEADKGEMETVGTFEF